MYCPSNNHPFRGVGEFEGDLGEKISDNYASQRPYLVCMTHTICYIVSWSRLMAMCYSSCGECVLVIDKDSSRTGSLTNFWPIFYAMFMSM